MKKILLILSFAMMSIAGMAQSQSFEFYYIAHDRTTPVADLCRRLEQVYDMARSYEDMAVVFYLPNFDEPKIVKVNLPGDNHEEFKGIISELRLKPAHEIFVEEDYQNILNIVNEHDFLTPSGEAAYSSVMFCWYVNPDFWQFKYNERLIASLYFALELDKHEGYVTTQVWHADNDGLVVDPELPFGNKNLCRKMNFMLQQY